MNVQVCVVHPYMRNTVYADKRKRRLSLLGEREEEEQVCRGQGTFHLTIIAPEWLGLLVSLIVFLYPPHCADHPDLRLKEAGTFSSLASGLQRVISN